MSKAKILIKLFEQEGSPDLPNAEELELFIDNDQSIYNRKIDAFKNLTKKKKAGTYDSALAPKLFSYVAEEAAKKAAKDWNDYNEMTPPWPWNKVYTKEVRQEVAKDLAKEFEDAWEAKEYNFMD